MLLRTAKLLTGLRLLVAEVAPIIATSIGLLSVRTAAYLIGFAFGSVGAGWLTIIAALVAATGLFGTSTNTAECEAYRAQMRAIDDANRAAVAAWQIAYKIYYDGPFSAWAAAAKALADSARNQAQSSCVGLPESQACVVCGGGGGSMSLLQ